MARGATLTPKMGVFISAYLSNGFNATQAAIAAKYAKKGAEVTGSKLLRNPKVKAELSKHQQKLVERQKFSEDEAFETARLVRDRAMEVVPATDDKGNPLGYFKFDGRTALAANDQMIKMTGLYAAEKHEVRDMTWEEILAVIK